jgi:hypothetical protein
LKWHKCSTGVNNCVEADANNAFSNNAHKKSRRLLRGIDYFAGIGSRGKRGRPRDFPDAGRFEAVFDALTMRAATVNGSVIKSLL